MKIGIVNFFSFRPYIENSIYLGKILKEQGHSIFYFECDGSPSICHNILIKKPSIKIIECLKCRAGGLGSYVDSVERVSKYSNIDNQESSPFDENWLLSSRATASRSETKSQLLASDPTTAEDHLKSVKTVYNSSINWLKSNKIDRVICFNGRMDFTRAMLEACNFLNIEIITHDSTWFGNGITISKNSEIIALHKWDKAVEDFIDYPLSEDQLKKSLDIISKRFLKKSLFEWKQYNINTKKVSWPINSVGKRILILPSSRSEFLGTEEFDSEWSDDCLVGFDKVIEELRGYFKEINIVVKAHPIWGMNLFGANGDNPIQHYRDWCLKNGYVFLNPEENASTSDLMKECDVILLNGSSAAFEGIFYKKPIINIAKSVYKSADFIKTVLSSEEIKTVGNYLSSFNWEKGIIRGLRFLYIVSSRIPSLLPQIRALNNTKNKYFHYPGNLLDYLFNDTHQYHDKYCYHSSIFEDKLMTDFSGLNWEDFIDSSKYIESIESEVVINRKLIYRWVDLLRNLQPKGDEK
jgi:hypothetical protein